jgi:cell wall-associated NlpC family hydrolase
MKRAKPRDLDRQRLQQVLLKARSRQSIGDRMDRLSRHFLLQSYKQNPLIGSPDTPEVFTASLDGFDCVTYIETVLALSRSSTPDEFAGWLRKIRYRDGRIEWKHRNHYMTLWLRNNIRIGVVRPIRSKVRRSMKVRTLNLLPGLRPVQTKFGCVPKQSLRGLLPLLQTGDLIFFASTRKNLDVFHCGILVRNDGDLRIRHASRTQNAVVEQDLTDFLQRNRMAGIIVARVAEDRSL